MTTSIPELRPLGVGERIDVSFKLFRANFRLIATAMLYLAIPSALVSGIIKGVALSNVSSLIVKNPDGTVQLNTNAVATTFGGLGVSLLVSLIVSTIAVATLFRIFGMAFVGQTCTPREALSAGFRRILSVIWISFLRSLIVFALVLATFALIVVVGLFRVQALTVIGVLLFGLAGTCATMYFLTLTSMALPLLMMDDLRGVKAIRRSLEIGRRSFWSVFGTLFLAEVLVLVISGLFGLVADVFGFLVPGSSLGLRTFVISFVSVLLTTVLIQPFGAAVRVVLMVDMRVRKEGFDIQLLAQSLDAEPTAESLSFMRPTGSVAIDPPFPPLPPLPPMEPTTDEPPTS